MALQYCVGFCHTSTWISHRYMYVSSYFPDSSVGKESACNAGDSSLIPGSGRSPGAGIGYPLQDSFLENAHGLRSLVDCSPWDHKESDMTEWLSTAHAVKAMIFPVVTYGCKSWTIKKAEHQELMFSNCDAGEDSSESLELQDQTSQS